MPGTEIVRRHPIRFEKPAPNFFEGALLGNGGLGVVVNTRPDAIVLHFGHNNVWDIRIEEKHADSIGTFDDVFSRIRAIDPSLDSLREDPWYRAYCEMTEENYRAPYPRPMPCGSVLFAFDRREVEVHGHTVHIERGVCEVHLSCAGEPRTLEVFVDQESDVVWLRLCDNSGQPSRNTVFNRIRVIPDPDTPAEFPSYVPSLQSDIAQISFRQVLPARTSDAGASSKDKAFSLAVRTSVRLDHSQEVRDLEASPQDDREFIACVNLVEGSNSELESLVHVAPDPCTNAYRAALEASILTWSAYWSRSSVILDDQILEEVWYWNLYFLNCAVKPGVICPGLWANWSYRGIGSAWHGDYHMNYNEQQAFWVTFTSNHVEKHLPYVDLVDHMLPVSRKWAKEFFGLSGAYFPHSAYPIDMNMMPYPTPHWGWEFCETPWSVQSLWWHYLYTMDEEFLKERAFTPMKDAVLFMVDYMTRPDAHGEGWDDDKFHIFPTVVPELYELTPGLKLNADCLVDLTLTKFLFKSFRSACQILQREQAESDLLAKLEDVLAHFPDYPTAESHRGTVFVSVKGESPEVIYNVPNSIMTVFPGEDHGLHSPPEVYEIAVNSYMNHRNEGGNDLVMYNMAGARLAKLDLERFKRQIQYCMLPNGTCTDRVLLSGGRYSDTMDFDFMANMGIWFENFGLPAVINECLMQSYNGIIRLFPNWPKGSPATFHTLRAVGGFLVSSATEDGRVQWVEVVSEAGQTLRLHNPWAGSRVRVTSQGKSITPLCTEGDVFVMETKRDQTIRFDLDNQP